MTDLRKFLFDVSRVCKYKLCRYAINFSAASSVHAQLGESDLRKCLGIKYNTNF